jgi:hypothetical protein
LTEETRDMSLISEKDKKVGRGEESGKVLDGESRRDRRAAEFFREVLTPAALRERAGGREFFALRPEAAAESYFVEPTRRAMTKDDFELRAAESVAEFVGALAALWAAEGRDELAAMCGRLGELASEFGGEEEQGEDVSPFVYVMF